MVHSEAFQQTLMEKELGKVGVTLSEGIIVPDIHQTISTVLKMFA